jgi:hypothetical protein
MGSPSRLVHAPRTRLGHHPTRTPLTRPRMDGPPRLVTALRPQRATRQSVRGWAAHRASFIRPVPAPHARLGSRPTRAPFTRPRMYGPPRLAPRNGLDARPAHPSADGRSTVPRHRATASTRDLPTRPRMGGPPRLVRAPRTQLGSRLTRARSSARGCMAHRASSPRLVCAPRT